MKTMYVKNLLCSIVVLSVSVVTAATYHIDPSAGAIDNDGSAGSPWNTLEDVAKSKTFAAGDTILLHDGYHGAPVVSGVYDTPVVFMAAAGAKPVLKTLFMGTARNIVFRGFTITREAATPYSTGYLVSLGAGASHVTVEHCTLYSVSDAMAWTAAEWDSKTSTAFNVAGPNNTIRACAVRNVRYGMSVPATAESTLVESTEFRYYVGDGIRVVADYGTYQYNQFLDNIATQSNHDANAILSWSYGPGGAGTDTVKGVTVRGNLVIDYTTPDHIFTTNPQCMGIGLYDGMFQDWVIENNVINVDTWHGISIYGGIDCRIINNTVTDMNLTSPGPPWIGIFNHKNGTPSTGCIVRNNISNKYNFNGTVINDHNVTLPNVPAYYGIYFVDYAGFDFHLKSSAAQAIDAGSSELAPTVDYEGTVRPQGSGVDIGAYEYAEPTGMIEDQENGRMAYAGLTSDTYYSVLGRRLQGIPDQYGVYLQVNGRQLVKKFFIK